MASAKTTTDHDEIKKWVEARGGCPARVKATGRGKADPGILRIDFPGGTGQDTLVKMSWDDWFKQFDANGLAFLYEPRTRFSKLIARPKRSRASTKKRSSAVARASTTAGSRASSPARSRTSTRGSTSTGRGSSSSRGTTARPRPKTTRPVAKRTTRSRRSRTSARS